MEETQKSQKTVLVVEDERQLANAVKEALAVHDFNVVMARTAEEGIAQLKNLKTVDAIWLDHYLMGTSNGLDFVIQIKSDPEWSKIPVFIVSNTASQQNVHSYIRLGVTNYYTKADYDIGQIINDLKFTLDKGEHIPVTQ
ncbi:MAG TPA: response regulator [Candidatus Paceibacterota bacterium]|nr:response regulator [Candidatus Paceibacterota bacterium]